MVDLSDYVQFARDRSGSLLSSQLLGRDVDINKLLSQRMNVALHRSLDIAISRFEDGDITGIMVTA